MRILASLVLLAPIAYQAQASTLSTATTTITPQNCNMSGAVSASCTLSAGSDTASSSATSNFTIASGLLDVIVNDSHQAGGFNDSPSGTAAASLSELIVVTGGVGTGILSVNFSGFDDATQSGSPATNPVLALAFGANSENYTPPASPVLTSFTTPFTFGTPLNLSASISASGTAPLLMANAASSANIEGQVTFSGFTVENANGQTIPGTVVLVPEPAVAILSGFGLIGLALASRTDKRK